MNDDEFIQPDAFCAVIQQRIVTAYCPLPLGACMWKHRLSGACTYSEEFANSKPLPSVFAAHVGLPQKQKDVVNILYKNTIKRIQKELSR